MKFLQSLFHFDRTAGAFEKIMTVFVVLFVGALLIWLVAASYGIGNSNLAQAHRLAHGGSASVFATLILLAAGFWAWFNWTDRIPFQVNDIVATCILLSLIILAVNANTGFFVYVR